MTSVLGKTDTFGWHAKSSAIRGKVGYSRGIEAPARADASITIPAQNNRRLPRTKVWLAPTLWVQEPKAGFCRNRQFSGQRAGTLIRPHVRQFVLAFSPRMDDTHKKDLTGVRSGRAAQGTERLGMGRPYVPVVRDENPPKNPVDKAPVSLESHTRRAGYPAMSPLDGGGIWPTTCTVGIAMRHESQKADSRVAVSLAKRPETRSGHVNSVSTRYATMLQRNQKNESSIPGRVNLLDVFDSSRSMKDCSLSQIELRYLARSGIE